MKQFIKKILLFSITFSVIFIITGQFYINNFIKAVFSEEALKLPIIITTLIFGDSHGMTSFDPKVVHNSFNASRDSENYFHTLYKMKALLKSNPQVKSVVLTYSYHNLSIAPNDHILYSDEYYFLLDDFGKRTIYTADNGQLLKYNYGIYNNTLMRSFIQLEHFVSSTFLWFKYDIGLPIETNKYFNFFMSVFKNDPKLNEHPLFPGNYSSINSNLKSDLINKILKEEYYDRGEIGASDIMIESLFSMAKLCYEKNIKLFLINTPVHSRMKIKIPDYYFKLHDRVLVELKNKFDNIYYFDFSSTDYPDSLFGDGDHLNLYGMERFSSEIRDLFTEKAKLVE